jgi:hypothetical protein
MSVGHYAPSFLTKRADQSVPLWVLFLAAQLVDVFWEVFVLVGIEHVRIVPGFTKSNPLDLYHMPYTHRLRGSLAWATLAAAGYALVTRNRRGSLLVGAAVFSHWILDPSCTARTSRCGTTRLVAWLERGREPAAA